MNDFYINQQNNGQKNGSEIGKQVNGRYIKSLYINIDGACKGNPGPAAFAVVIKDNYGKILEEYSEFIGNGTNNLAEYKAAIKALELAAKYCRNRIYIFSDSELLVNHITGKYRIRKQELLKLLTEMKILEMFFRRVRYFHIDRERNAKANNLVNSVFNNSNGNKFDNGEKIYTKVYTNGNKNC